MIKHSLLRYVLLYAIMLPAVCLAASCTKKQYTVEGNISGLGSVKMYVYVYEGKMHIPVDTIQSENDKLIIEFPEETPSGMYHLTWSDDVNQGFDFVFNKENFSFTARADSVFQTLVFENSPENDLFYAYYPIKLVIESLVLLGDRLNKEDPMGNKPKLIELSHYLDSLEFSTLQSLDQLDNETQQLLSYKIIRAAFYPNYDYYLSQGGKPYKSAYLFMQQRFFDNIDFHEPGLVRTPFIYNAIDDYIWLYVYPPEKEQYQKACDMIISKAAVNDDMYAYVTTLLAGTFENSDFWEVYLYIMETYMTDICSEDGTYSDKMKLYEVVKNCRPGNQAADISGITPDGQTISMKEDVHAKVIVLFFWSPDCEHCKQTIDQLVTIWPAYKEMGLSIVAFGLTTNKEEWLQAINDHHMEDWIHITDLKELESPAFDVYHIRGTPEMYVLKNDFEIFSRPLNYMMLDRDLMQLLK